MFQYFNNAFERFFTKNIIFRGLWALIIYSLNGLFINLIEIFKNFKKVMLFFIILPFTFFIIKYQLYIGFIILLYYLFNFIMMYFLKTEGVIKCEEIPLNTSYLNRYALYNMFIGIPRAKAYVINYNCLYFLLNEKLFKKLSFYDFIILIIITLLLFFIKFSIFLIFGVSYLSLYISSKTINKLFNLLRRNYESNKARYQLILLNCVIAISNSVAEADEKKIIFKNGSVIFNEKSIFHKFLSTVKDIKFLEKGYQIDGMTISNIKSEGAKKGHFTFVYESKYGENGLATNVTSTEHIKVSQQYYLRENTTKDYSFKDLLIKLNTKYIPNVVGENKYNYFTNPHELDWKTAVELQLAPDLMVKILSQKKRAQSVFLESKDEEILYWKDGKFFKMYGSPTVKEYCDEFKLSLSEKIQFIEYFEKINEDYLNTNEGRDWYNLYKAYLIAPDKEDFFKNLLIFNYKGL